MSFEVVIICDLCGVKSTPRETHIECLENAKAAGFNQIRVDSTLRHFCRTCWHDHGGPNGCRREIREAKK